MSDELGFDAPPDAPPGLVWLASYPKSGNTWLRALLANVMSGRLEPEPINDLHAGVDISSSRPLFEQRTLVDASLLTLAEIEGLRPLVYGEAESYSKMVWHKTHEAYTRLADGRALLGGKARAAVYLVRDPRDQVISWAHHTGLSVDRAVAYSLSAETRLADGRYTQLIQRLGDWSGHVRSWLEQADMPVHLMRYEDLHADTAATFSRALDFLGVRYTAAMVERAVRHSDFAELRRQEEAHGFDERLHPEQAFFRKGRVGDWRQELSLEQISLIESHHCAMMQRLGYALGSSESLAANGPFC